MELKRDTRVQAIIVENGKFILLKQVFRDTGRAFWGIPGGGREEGETDEEAALREVREETGLDVALLSMKIEEDCSHESSIYKRKVTYMAYPISGTAKLGYDPEPEYTNGTVLEDLKWHDFYDDEGLDEITKSQIKPFREMLKDNPFTKRAGAIVYKVLNGKAYYLLVTAQNNGGIYVVPQGHNEPGETMEETARRETAEEAGAKVEIEKKLGFFFHKNQEKGEMCYTEIYLASFVEDCEMQDNRQKGWYTFEETKRLNIRRETKSFLEEVNEELEKRI